MDTSPGPIVCCNRLDTAGEVLSKGKGGGLIHELLKWLERRCWGICPMTINEENHV